MDRPSTLALTKSMRESGYPIVDLVYLDWCGTFVTYDHFALRVWDLRGQLKCVHHNKADSDYKLMKLSVVPAVQKVIAIYSKKTASESEKSCNKIRVYSELLSIVQEIELDLPKLERVIICPDNQSLVLMDVSKTVSILYIDQPGSEFDEFYAALTLKPADEEGFRPKTASQPSSVVVKVRNLQQIDCSELAVIDMIAIDNNTLFFLTKHSILVITRPRLQKEKEKTDVESMLKSSPKRRKSRIDQKPEDELKKAEEAKYPFHEFAHTATLRLNLDADGRKPQKITKIDKRLLSLVYEDGWMDVIQFSTHLTCREPKKRSLKPNLYETMVVTSFQVNDLPAGGGDKTTAPSSSSAVVSKKPPLKSPANSRPAVIRVVEATNCNTYGAEGYSAEFFTVDRDFRIVHWGLRPLSLYSEAFDGYSLASTSLTNDAQSQANTNDDATIKSSASFVENPKKATVEEAADNSSSTDPYVETLDLSNIQTIAFQQPLTQRMLPDFLGDVQLHDEAKVNPSIAAAKPGYGTIHLSFMELRNVDNKPVSKHLIGAHDGMIMVFDVRHPHFTIREWSSSLKPKKNPSSSLAATKRLAIEDARAQDLHNSILQGVRGPDLSSIDGHFLTEGEAGMDPKGGISTVLLTKKEQLELISMRDGSVLRTYPLHNLREQMHQRAWVEQLKQTAGGTKSNKSKSSAMAKTTKGRLAEDLATAGMEHDLEGEVSCVHFCPYTHWIFVGYSSGTVGAFSMHEQDMQDVDLGFTYLRTNAVHSNSISHLRTFPFLYNHLPVTDHLDPIKPKQINVLFVGDSSGQFTLWQIYPKRQDGRAMFFQSRQHTGRICSAAVCYVPQGKITHDFAIAAQARYHEVNSNHNILITACERGLVHAWRMEQNLQLHLISFFHSTHFPTRMTSCLALPKMIYREFLVPNPDAPESMFSSLMEDPTKNRNPEFQNFTKKQVTDDGGRITAASLYAQREILDAFIPMANLCYEVYCILGFADGQTEIWSLSSDPRYSASFPSFQRKLVASPVSSFTLYNPDIVDGIIHEPTASIMHEFTLINVPKLEGDDVLKHSYHVKPDDTFITAHRNGTMVVSRLKINPLYSVDEYTRIRENDDFSKRFFLENLVYFQAPQPSIVSVVPLQPNHVPVGVSDYDLAVISEFGVYEVLPVVSKYQLIPEQWHQNTGNHRFLPSSIDRPGNEGEYEQGGKRRRPYQSTRLSSEDILSLHSDAYSRLSISDAVEINEGPVLPLSETSSPALGGGRKHALSRARTASTASLLQLTDATPTTIQDIVHDLLEASQPGSARSHSSLRSLTNGSKAAPGGAPSSAVSTNASTLEELSQAKPPASGRRQYIGPMETMQRIVSSDLHIAKKDKRLLELFTFEMDPRESSVTADTAVDIICQWVNENRSKILKNVPHNKSETSSDLDVRRENLQELFQILELNAENRLKFIEVAKIAAITASAMRKAAEINAAKASSAAAGEGGGGLLTSQSTSALQPYQQMKSSVTKVTYNAMGERVVEKKTFDKATMGVVDGSYTELRKTLYDHVAMQKKIDKDVQATMSYVAKIPRKLKRIPPIFHEILQPQKLPLRCPDDVDPQHWHEDQLHYFDVAKAIRMARGILDLRAIKQHAFIENPKHAQSLFLANPTAIESIPKVTVLYFERDYGECSRSMNVSRYKISNFLEACLQYEYFPLLKLMQYLNQLDGEYATSPGFQVGVWLVVEARTMLLARGSVIFGESIDAYEKLHARDEQLDPRAMGQSHASGDPSGRIVRFQYVTPVEANMVADELLRVRGGFGPDLYMPILEDIARIPTKSRAQVFAQQATVDMMMGAEEEAVANDHTKEEDKLLDVENFLEELFRLFVLHVSIVDSLDNRIFGEASLNVAVTAMPREINRPQTQSRLMIMDDDAAGFGPHHVSNMQRIRQLVHQCIRHDPLRTGTITEEDLLRHCRAIFLVPGDDGSNHHHRRTPLALTATATVEGDTDVPQHPMIIDQEEEDRILMQRFYRAVQTRLKLHNVQEEASYVDLLALLFSWEEYTQGAQPITIDSLMPIIPKMERLVEMHLVNDIVRYVTKASMYDNVIRNPVWVMMSPIAKAASSSSAPSSATTTNPYFTMPPSSTSPAMGEGGHTGTAPRGLLSLPMDGDWHMNVKPPDNEDAPGMLFAAPAPRIPYHAHTLMAVKKLRHRVPYATTSWFTKDPLPLAPQVISNQREMKSILGETVRLQGATKAPAAIRVTTMDDALTEVARAATTTLPPALLSTPAAALASSGGEEDAARIIRTSYSRLLNSMQVIPSTPAPAMVAPGEFFGPPGSPTALASGASSIPPTRSPMAVIGTVELPLDAGLDKIHSYLVQELQLDEDTANAAMAMIMEQYNAQDTSPSPEWQRRLWALLTAPPMTADGKDVVLNGGDSSDDDHHALVVGEAALVDQSLSKLLLHGSGGSLDEPHEDGVEGVGGNVGLGGTRRRSQASKGEDEADDDDIGARDLPYKLLRQNSDNSNDSNYQEYALELKQQQQLQQQQQQQQLPHQQSGGMRPPSDPVVDETVPSLPPITRRPVTNELAALTPFLDFKESDFFVPTASSTAPHSAAAAGSKSRHDTTATTTARQNGTSRGSSGPPHQQQTLNTVANFLMSSSLQEFLQLDESQASNSQVIQRQQHQWQQQHAPLPTSPSLSQSMTSLPMPSLSDMNRSLASEEIHRRILQLQDLEEQFAEMYSVEKDEYKRREIEKQRLREMIRREMLLKERAAMKYYRQALNRRSQFLSKGRAQLADALAKEMEDKQEKEREIQRILEQNRNRLQERQEQKKQDEWAQRQRELEEKERTLMRKEEKASIRVETVYREERRRQAAADKAKADAEWVEQMKSLQAMAMANGYGTSTAGAGEGEGGEEGESFASHGRRVKSRGGGEDDDGLPPGGDDNVEIHLVTDDTTSGKGLSHKKSSMFDSLLNDGGDGEKGGLDGDFDENDENDGDDNDDHDGDDNDDDENGYVDDDQAPSTADNTRPSTTMAAAAISFFKASHDVNDADADDEALLTPIEKRIRLLLANMKSSVTVQKNHPRKSLQTKQAFFFPQTFASDIVFNPFQNVSDALAQSYLSPEVPYVDPSELNAVEVIFDPFTMAAPIETDLFGDITAAVKQYRKDQELERRSLLSTKLGDVMLEEFLPLYRNGVVDWASFFRTEKKRLKSMKQRMIAAAEQEARAFEFDPDEFSASSSTAGGGGGGGGNDGGGRDSSMSIMDAMSMGGDSASSLLGPNFGRKNNDPLHRRPSTSPFENGVYRDATAAATAAAATGGEEEDDATSGGWQHIPKTILQVLPKDPKRDIVPLPFGKVKQRQVVFPGQLKFYQMEVPYLDTMVTVELKCSRGLASMFLHYNKLPSTVKYEEKANCTRENNRWARLSFVPKITGSYFLAITSLDAGAEYEVWAYSTGEAAEKNPRLQQVDQVLKKWRYILQHSDAELQIHYPRINQEAIQHADQAAKEEAIVMQRKKQVIQELQQIKASDGGEEKVNEWLQRDPALPADWQPKDEEERQEMIAEMENVEAFVVKVGRYAMRREREMKQYRQMLLMKSNQAATHGDGHSLTSRSQDSQESQHSQRSLHGHGGGVGGPHDAAGAADGVVTATAMATVTTVSNPNEPTGGVGLSRVSSSDTIQSYDNHGNVLRASIAPSIAPDGSTVGGFEDATTAAAAAAVQAAGAAAQYDDDVFADENPNQHADLFSTPASHRMASMAMFAAVPHTHTHHAHHDAHHPHGQHHHTHHTHHAHHAHQHPQHSHHSSSTGHHSHSHSHSHDGPTVVASSTLPPEMVAPIEETFEQELERVLIEETAISQEQVASHTAFSLPALNLKYKGSDMYFEKDFGATLTPKHGSTGAAAGGGTGGSGIPKLPAIAGATNAPTGMAKLLGGLLRPSEENDDGQTNVDEKEDHANDNDNGNDNNEPRHEAAAEGSNDVAAHDVDDNDDDSISAAGDAHKRDADEDHRALLYSATMPQLHPVHSDAGGGATSSSPTKTLPYSFSAAEIRENRRREKQRLKMLPPELRTVPKPVSYALRMDQQIPEKWTHSPATATQGKKKTKGLATGSSLELK